MEIAGIILLLDLNYDGKIDNNDGTIMIEGIGFTSFENISTLGDEKAINNIFYTNYKKSA